MYQYWFIDCSKRTTWSKVLVTGDKHCEAQCTWPFLQASSPLPTRPHRTLLPSVLCLNIPSWSYSSYSGLVAFPWTCQDCSGRRPLHWPFSLPGILSSWVFTFYSGLLVNIPLLERPFLTILHEIVSLTVYNHKTCILFVLFCFMIFSLSWNYWFIMKLFLELRSHDVRDSAGPVSLCL